jgi:hypothetical protein
LPEPTLLVLLVLVLVQVLLVKEVETLRLLPLLLMLVVLLQQLQRLPSRDRWTALIRSEVELKRQHLAAANRSCLQKDSDLKHGFERQVEASQDIYD